MDNKLYEIIGRMYVDLVNMQNLLKSLGEKDQEILALKEDLAFNKSKLAELARDELNKSPER